MDDFDEDDEREEAQAEWQEDCERAGLKISAELDKGLFANALVSTFCAQECQHTLAVLTLTVLLSVPTRRYMGRG